MVLRLWPGQVTVEKEVLSSGLPLLTHKPTFIKNMVLNLQIHCNCPCTKCSKTVSFQNLTELLMRSGCYATKYVALYRTSCIFFFFFFGHIKFKGEKREKRRPGENISV